MSPNPDLTLYHAPRTRSIRVRWLLEEMGLPYRIKPVQFSQRPAGDEAYADIHPLRKVPALTDGDTKTFESLAIMQYLMGRYGPTPCDVPAHDPAYGDYLKWLHFGESGMLMPVSLLLAHTTLLPEDRRDANLAAWAKSETGHLLEALSVHAIGDRDYVVAGRLTAADMSIGYMLYLLKIIRQFSGAPENVKAYSNV